MSMTSAWAVKLSDYSPYEFEVLFTNPVCAEYEGKPKDVYCKQADEAASIARKNAPQYRLKEWISDRETKELYLAYLSFSVNAHTLKVRVKSEMPRPARRA